MRGCEWCGSCGHETALSPERREATNAAPRTRPVARAPPAIVQGCSRTYARVLTEARRAMPVACCSTSEMRARAASRDARARWRSVPMASFLSSERASRSASTWVATLRSSSASTADCSVVRSSMTITPRVPATSRRPTPGERKDRVCSWLVTYRRRVGLPIREFPSADPMPADSRVGWVLHSERMTLRKVPSSRTNLQRGLRDGTSTR